MEWGGKIEFLLNLKKQGKNPPALQRRPNLKRGLDFYLMAFNELLSDRPMGMAVGPIPWSSIDRWALRHNITDTQAFDTLVTHIRGMEAALREKEANKPTKGTS